MEGTRNMKKLWILAMMAILLMACGRCEAQIEGNEVEYLGGTTTITEGTVGMLDFSSTTDLIVRLRGATLLSIPYKGLQRVTYRREVTHHIGVLPAIAVGLVRKRKRQHFFDLSYEDAQGNPQSIALEVSKREPPILYDIFRARAPQICDHGQCASIEAELKASQSGYGR